jgi:hypothetical protein
MSHASQAVEKPNRFNTKEASVKLMDEERKRVVGDDGLEPPTSSV